MISGVLDVMWMSVGHTTHTKHCCCKKSCVFSDNIVLWWDWPLSVESLSQHKDGFWMIWRTQQHACRADLAFALSRFTPNQHVCDVLDNFMGWHPRTPQDLKNWLLMWSECYDWSVFTTINSLLTVHVCSGVHCVYTTADTQKSSYTTVWVLHNCTCIFKCLEWTQLNMAATAHWTAREL